MVRPADGFYMQTLSYSLFFVMTFGWNQNREWAYRLSSIEVDGRMSNVL